MVNALIKLKTHNWRQKRIRTEEKTQGSMRAIIINTITLADSITHVINR